MTHPIRIGIGGWTYEPWRGVFYPADLTRKKAMDGIIRQTRDRFGRGDVFARFIAGANPGEGRSYWPVDIGFERKAASHSAAPNACETTACLSVTAASRPCPAGASTTSG